MRLRISTAFVSALLGVAITGLACNQDTGVTAAQAAAVDHSSGAANAAEAALSAAAVPASTEEQPDSPASASLEAVPLEVVSLETVSLAYRRYPDIEEAEGPFVFRGELQIECLPAPPAGDWKMPEFVSAQPIYALAAFGESEHLFVLDREDADDIFYNRLYCDANGNRDLTDDAPIGEADGLPLPGLMESVPFDVMQSIDGEQRAYSLYVVAYSEEMVDVLAEGEEYTDEIDFNEFAFKLRGNCCYSGAFEAGGRTYQVMLGDDDVNGFFGEPVAYVEAAEANPRRPLETSGDLLFLTDEPAVRELDSGRLGNLLSLAGELYRLRVSRLGDELTLERLAGALATVRLPFAPERLFLASEDGKNHVTILEPGREAQLPADRYHVAGYRLLREDDQGDLWSVSAVATPRSRFVTFRAGETSDLQCGEPFSPEASIHTTEYASFARGMRASVQVEFSILGIGDEAVGDIRHVSGNATEILLDASGSFPQEARFRVMEKTGKMIASGIFEYG